MTVVEIIDAGLERLEAAQSEAESVAAFEQTRDTVLLKPLRDAAADAIRAGLDDDDADDRMLEAEDRARAMFADGFPTDAR